MLPFALQVVAALPKVRSYALKLCMNSMLADDLVQETALRALEKEHQFEPGSNLTGWLMTICRNFYLTHLKKNNRIVLDPDDVFASHLAGASNTLAALEAKDALSFIVELPDEIAHILLMRSSGKSYEEIAAELSVPCGTVKSRIHRGRVMLSELIGDPDLMHLGGRENA
jgi:RNA polymerase sigma-70 factor, ECF subfamily